MKLPKDTWKKRIRPNSPYHKIWWVRLFGILGVSVTVALDQTVRLEGRS